MGRNSSKIVFTSFAEYAMAANLHFSLVLFAKISVYMDIAQILIDVVVVDDNFCFFYYHHFTELCLTFKGEPFFKCARGQEPLVVCDTRWCLKPNIQTGMRACQCCSFQMDFKSINLSSGEKMFFQRLAQKRLVWKMNGAQSCRSFYLLRLCFCE